jgi:hypothetical protein
MIAASLMPGAALCNIFPIRKYQSNFRFSMIYRDLTDKHLVRHIPTWFPGAKFKRHAFYCRKLTNEMPFEFVKKNMVLPFLSSSRHHLTASLGKWGMPFITSEMIESMNNTDGEQDDFIRQVSGTAYGGKYQ